MVATKWYSSCSFGLVKSFARQVGRGRCVTQAKEKTPSDVFDPIVEKGEAKLQRGNWDLALSGLIAGLDISLGALAMAVLAGKLHTIFRLPLKEALFIGAFLYPVGFVVVILGRSELFTENTLAPVAGLLHGEGSFVNLARYWLLIYATNIMGAILFSLLIAHVAVVFSPYRAAYRAIGSALVQNPFHEVLLAGIIAGWLVALIAWLVEAVEGNLTHLLIIYVLAYLIVGLSLAHCVIGSTEVLLAMFAGAPITWGAWLGSFLLPTTIGNIIGGVTFVTALKGFQAASGQP